MAGSCWQWEAVSLSRHSIPNLRKRVYGILYTVYYGVLFNLYCD